MVERVGKPLIVRPRIFDPAGDTGSTHHSAPANVGALAQLVERLLCKQDVIGSNPLGSTIPDTIRKRFAAFSSCRTRMRGMHFTSFREIIGVIGRTRVWVRCQYDPWIGKQQ